MAEENPYLNLLSITERNKLNWPLPMGMPSLEFRQGSGAVIPEEENPYMKILKGMAAPFVGAGEVLAEQKIKPNITLTEVSVKPKSKLKKKLLKEYVK